MGFITLGGVARVWVQGCRITLLDSPLPTAVLVLCSCSCSILQCDRGTSAPGGCGSRHDPVKRAFARPRLLWFQ
ncbi:MAG: hypothetical protein CVU63_23885 [Deltaproteobacteria bacterium HGW-Deltaproteobacteria-20]|nr:MAG: hypothetical protein CVU63_23885 [Deltaproteobacteria bacterium HGW-Deltaproteobacteria-20]